MNDELQLKLESNEFSTMWELVTDILMKYSGKLYLNEKFEIIFSPYLLCRYISMRESLIEYANYLNKINSNSKLTKKQFYLLAYNLIPKQNNSFIKYIKKPVKIKKDAKDTTIDKPDSISTNLFDL